MADFIALTSKGIESLLSDELLALGASEVKISVQSVSFTASLTDAYHICLWSRLASRVLLLVESAKVNHIDDLYAAALAIDWQSYMRVEQYFAIDFIGTNHFVKNSQFGGLKVKDAIADHFVNVLGKRPSIDKYDPDVIVQVRLWRDEVKFYVDFSGPSLHHRGYRQSQGDAPLKENLAAAIIIRSGWLEDISQPLIDPFCGSGTLLIEAVQMARRVAPGLVREHFAFESLPSFDGDALDRLKVSAQAEQQALPQWQVVGSDINQKMIHIARENAAAAGIQQCIDFRKIDAARLTKSHKQAGIIVCNPPYGERLGHIHQLAQLYAQFGLAVKQHFCGWQLVLFSQEQSPVKQLRLARSKSYKLRNGPLACELYRFDLTERQCQINQSVSGTSDLVYNFQQSGSFYDRLQKNHKKFSRQAQQAQVNCYRVYDADIPEYNVAVDRYADHVVVSEYAPPKSIDATAAQRRLADVLAIVPNVLDVPYQNMALKVRQKQKGSQQYQPQESQQQRFKVQEFGVQFWVNIHDYLDTGLFLDHRLTRQMLGQMAAGKSVLNLFAYTATASVHAAVNGATKVTSVDMSNTYLEWAKHNFALNGISVNAHRDKYQFIQADCLQWITQANAQQVAPQFDLIFVDPPTFSNSKRMTQTFDVLRDHVSLLLSLQGLLAPGGTLLFSNNHRRFILDEPALVEAGYTITNISKRTIPFDFQRDHKIHQCWLLTKEHQHV